MADKIKLPKLSAYTHANNCADIVDCQDGLAEIRDAMNVYFRAKKQPPLYYYSRICKLEQKLEKLSQKHFGMSYNQAVVKFGYDNLRY